MGCSNAYLAAANRAAQLEPTRAGYALLAANLMLQMGRPKDAASVAKYVADRWQGADHDEAIELWNRVPEQERPTWAPVQGSGPDDTKQLEGLRGH